MPKEPAPEPPFAVKAAGRCPGLADLALSLAEEFGEVDRTGALAALDRLASVLLPTAGMAPTSQCDALASLLGDLLSPAEGEPDDLLLDRVVERGRGHPALLALIWVEVAARAGMPIAAVGAPGLLLAGHLEAPLLLDPTRPGVFVRPDLVPVRLRRRCSHEVAFALLDELMDIYALAGDVRSATRAAELRLALPVRGPALEAVRREADALRARI